MHKAIQFLLFGFVVTLVTLLCLPFISWYEYQTNHNYTKMGSFC